MSKSELQKIAEVWVKAQHTREDEYGENFWAVSKMIDLCEDEPETCWEVIHLIRKHDGSEVLLANLAAGPVEDLIVKHGASFIDRIEVLAKSDGQFKKILGAVWQQDMPDAVWERVKAVAGPSW